MAHAQRPVADPLAIVRIVARGGEQGIQIKGWASWDQAMNAVRRGWLEKTPLERGFRVTEDGLLELREAQRDRSNK